MISFAGEEYLLYIPPIHSRTNAQIVTLGAALFVVIFIFIPTYVSQTQDNEGTNNGECTKEIIQTDDNNNVSDIDDDHYVDMKQMLHLFYMFPKLLYSILIFTLLLFSPQNHETDRRIFQAPILYPHECKTIIDMATAEAAQKYQDALHMKQEIDNQDSLPVDETTRLKKLLHWPEGWSKDRHGSYPTTDFNLATDFDDKSKEYIQEILDARMAPLLERIYGISQDAIRADDMFLVRYDGNGQQHLAKHRDGTILSINILLNDDFEGGGTKFFLTEQLQEDIARPRVGEGIIHNSIIEHEGMATTKGTRYILVGFLNVDRVNSLTGEKSTHVDIFSTYLSFHWLLHFISYHLPERISNMSIHNFTKQL